MPEVDNVHWRFAPHNRVNQFVSQGVVFTASGGISGMSDIEELDRIGVPKVIVGKAIYEKRITLDDIRKWSLNA